MNLKGLSINNRVTLQSIAPNPLILDTLTAAAAYSLRKLRTAYSGAAIEVRNGSNAVADIGFNAGVLDTTALLAHTGGGNGFITKWYDQSGNGLNVVQNTAGSQPQIVASGSVILQNSKPAITSVSKFLQTVSQSTLSSGTASSTINAVLRTNAFANNQAVGYGYPSGSQMRAMGVNTGPVLQYISYGGGSADLTPSTSVGTTNNYIQTGIWGGTVISGFSNGAAVSGSPKTVTTLATPASSYLTVGAIPGTGANSTNPFNGNIQEVIIFNSALSGGDRGTLESNQATFYGITLA